MVLGVSLLLFGALVVYAGLHHQSVSDVLTGKPGTPLGESLLPSDTFATSGAAGSSASTNPLGIGPGGLFSGTTSVKVGNGALKFGGRIDMGVDFVGSGPIPAVAAGTVTRAVSSGSGWPGGTMIAWRLDSPISSNGITANYLYCAENIAVKCHVGQHLAVGDVIGNARGVYPFIEYGFAADANGTTLSAAHGTQNTHPAHANTPEGLAFAHFMGIK